MIREYYLLTKPGIVRGNLMNTLGGFLLASYASIEFGLLAATLAGTALVIACACVTNNYLDRGIDSKMKRTKNRALVDGRISNRSALTYAATLGVVGFLILGFYTNTLTLIIGLLAWFMYVVVYGYFKRRSVFGTLVGSIPGALPPVAGYVAVTGEINLGAWIVFAILVTWQMAHFYSIGLYRVKEYGAAGLPIKPVVEGADRTKRSILAYIVAFGLACSLLTIKGYAGYIFLIVMLALTGAWLYLGITNYKTNDSIKWGKKMFLFSLTVILSLAIMFALGARLP